MLPKPVITLFIFVYRNCSRREKELCLACSFKPLISLNLARLATCLSIYYINRFMSKIVLFSNCRKMTLIVFKLSTQFQFALLGKLIKSVKISPVFYTRILNIFKNKSVVYSSQESHIDKVEFCNWVVDS